MNNNFLELMNEINQELPNLKDDPLNDEIYNNIKNNLIKLESLIEEYKIPKDIYLQVNEFDLKCRRYIEFLKLKNNDKIK